MSKFITVTTENGIDILNLKKVSRISCGKGGKVTIKMGAEYLDIEETALEVNMMLVDLEKNPNYMISSLGKLTDYAEESKEA